MNREAGATTDRSVRVFVSSTFRDMHEERDVLVKRVFPQLRRLCEERGVVWGEVDLRWGITDEQKAEGKVLPICLEEIKRCRPYFIGILGERYGWVPDEIPGELVVREPWLAQHRELSVTELEILHGVLNDPEIAGHAFFYFRDPNYLKNLPPEVRTDFEAEDAESARKLRVLKDRVRNSDVRTREDYTDPQTFADLVLQDFTALIDKQFPRLEYGGMDDYTEAVAQWAFASERAIGYVDRRDYCERLDAYLAEGGKPLLVTGKSGCGKSSLLANWHMVPRGVEDERKWRKQRHRSMTRSIWLVGIILGIIGIPFVLFYLSIGKWLPAFLALYPHLAQMPARERHSLWVSYMVPKALRLLAISLPLVFGAVIGTVVKTYLHSSRKQASGDGVVVHFVGAAPSSSRPGSLMERVIQSSNYRFHLGILPFENPYAQKERFNSVFAKMPKNTRLIVVIDGLDYLDGRDGKPDIDWLPEDIAPNARLVVSASHGPIVAEAERRGWSTLEIEPCNEAERRQIILSYFASYAKTLAPSLVARIAEAPQTRDPVYLSLLLSELRLHGEHTTLEMRIKHYLTASDAGKLFGYILERFEQDYESDRPNLVGDVMTLIWASHGGLLENELLQLLGSRGRPLPQAYWSPLRMASESFLRNRAGLIDFQRSELKQAVEDRYLSDETVRAAAHTRLIEYFEATAKRESRIQCEMAWQLYQAQSYERLYQLISSEETLKQIWSSSENDVKTYWRAIESHTPFRAVDAYKQILHLPDRNSCHTWHIWQLLMALGHAMEAVEQLEERDVQPSKWLPALQVYCQLLRDDYNSLGASNGQANKGSILEHLRTVYEKVGDKNGVQWCWGERADIFLEEDQLESALSHSEAQARVCRTIGDSDSLATALSRQASALYRLERPSEALDVLRESESVCRSLGDDGVLQGCLGMQGAIMVECGELEGALPKLIEQEQICARTGDRESLQWSLGQQGLYWLASEDYLKAHESFTRAEHICREIDNTNELQWAIGRQGLALWKLGRQEEALARIRQQQSICQEYGLADDNVWPEDLERRVRSSE